MSPGQDQLTSAVRKNQTSSIAMAEVPTHHLKSTDPLLQENGKVAKEALGHAKQASDSDNPHGGPCGFITRLFPPGGLLSTVFNLASASIGGGILGLPAAANGCGLAFSVIYNIIIAIFTVQSLYCISIIMERTGCKSYEKMSGLLLGRGFDYFACAVRFLNTFGACVAYVISIGNIFTAILTNVESTPEYLKTTSGNRLLTSGVWLVILLPLVIPRHINSLRHVSAVGVSFMVYFVFIIIVHSSMNGLKENVKQVHLIGSANDKGIHLIGTGNAALSDLGVYLFSFTCHIGAFEVFWDMDKPTARRFTAHSAISTAVVLVLYAAAGFFGYLDFGSRVSDSILLMYNPIGKPAVMVAYVGVLVKLCASYTILAMTTRNSVYYVLKWDPDTVAFWKHCIAVVSLSLLMLLCGLFIPKINMVLGFVGGICGGFLAFIFPALFIMYGGNWSLKSVGWFQYLITYALLICGVIAMVCSTVSSVYSVILGK